MRGAPCIVSVADHTGWAHLVCVAAIDTVPVVVARRKVALLDPGLPAQPYEHATAGMTDKDADALVERVRLSAAARSALALRHVMADLSPAHAVIALAIREPSIPDLPVSVAIVRRSYQLQCAADGLLYQFAIRAAARQVGLQVHLCPRGEEVSRAAEHAGATPADVERFIARTGRPPGPPWTQEHRRAYAAGIAVLAAQAAGGHAGRLRLP